MAQPLPDQISNLRSSTQSRWNDQNSQLFFEHYFVRLQESAENVELMSRALEEEIRSLQRDMAAVEAVLYL